MTNLELGSFRKTEPERMNDLLTVIASAIVLLAEIQLISRQEGMSQTQSEELWRQLDVINQVFSSL